jgi:hypothetical protein
MKKLAFAALIVLAAASFASAKKHPDYYSDKKMHPTERTTLEKFLGTNRYDVLDECAIYIPPIAGKIKAKKGNFIYRRGTDVAGFRIYYDTTAYTLEMAREPRQVCCDAIDKYFDDFENKRLDRKAGAKKARTIYGSAPGYQEFGVIRDMMNGKAKPTFDFGYAFIDGNPYFVIHVEKAPNLMLKTKTTDLPNRETIIQNYYFTRAQAKKLRDFICEENISLFHAQEEENLAPLKAISEADEYVEAPDDVPEKKGKKAKKAKKAKAQPDADEYNEDDVPIGDDYTEIKK